MSEGKIWVLFKFNTEEGIEDIVSYTDKEPEVDVWFVGDIQYYYEEVGKDE